MAWNEIKRLTGNTLPSYISGEKGWPTPEDPSFWRDGFSTAEGGGELMPFLGQQIKRYTQAYSVFRTAIVSSYGLLVSDQISHPSNEEAEQRLKQQPDILQALAIGNMLRGPMIDIFLDHLGIDQIGLRRNRWAREDTQRSQPESLLTEFKDESVLERENLEAVLRKPELRLTIQQLPPEIKALGWWSLWISSGDKREVTKLLIELGLEPPKVI